MFHTIVALCAIQIERKLLEQISQLCFQNLNTTQDQFVNPVIMQMQFRLKHSKIIYLEGIGFYRLLYGRWIKVLADGKIHRKNRVH